MKVLFEKAPNYQLDETGRILPTISERLRDLDKLK